jgi:large subunit ribosomal protein L5
MNNLFEKYRQGIKEDLKKELKLTNSLAVPRMIKVVVSMGLKEGVKDQGVIDKNKVHLEAITGLRPKICRAKKSIAAFSLGKGNPIGLAVTLRGKRMYDFLEKLFKVVLPRLRDFRGVPVSGFDGRGNYNLGTPEIIVFPEVDFTKIDKPRGLEINLVTNAKDDKSAQLLLESLGMPFAKET